MKDENSVLLVDFHNILNRWKNYFSQLLKVHNVSDVRQIEVIRLNPVVLKLKLLLQAHISYAKVCVGDSHMSTNSTLLRNYVTMQRMTQLCSNRHMSVAMQW
jgi:hypothetical protein